MRAHGGDTYRTRSATALSIGLVVGLLAAAAWAAPAVGVDPASRDFGGIEVGQSAAQTFTVTNTGDADLVVGTLVLAGGDAAEFAIQNDTCSGQTLGAGESATVDVRFSPTGYGARSTTLVIPSNVPDANVALAGTGATVAVVVVDDSGRLYTAWTRLDGTFGGYRDLGVDIGDYSRCVAMGDYDKDGDNDFVAGACSGSALRYYYFENNGNNTFTNHGLFDITYGGNTWAMDSTAGDFDGDGNLDFIANSDYDRLALYVGHGDGTFTFAHSIPSSGGNGRGIDAADFDNDGDLDFARARHTSGYLHLYLNDGSGNFSYTNYGVVGNDPYGVICGDFDGDGNVDLITNNGGGGDTHFRKGNGDGTFQAGVYISSLDVNNHGSFDAYDYDRDGDLDVVIANYSGRQVLYFPGNGDGTFGASTLLGTTSYNALSIAAPPATKGYGAPTAVASYAPAPPEPGETVNFDGTGSSDVAPGTIAGYAWDFGDATAATGATPTHAYAGNEGDTFHGSLTVTDNDGNTDADGFSVQLTGDPPVADAGGPYTAGEDVAVGGRWVLPLDGTGSSDDHGITEYCWTVRQDTFDGTTFDGQWIYSAGASQNDAVSVTGSANTWGIRYLCTRETVYRGQGTPAFECRVRPPSGYHHFMIGFKNTSTSYHYGQYVYALYFANGDLHIYEDGASRGLHDKYATDVWYDVRIELKDTAGARYYLRRSGSPYWKLVRDSSHSSATDFRFGIDVHSNTIQLDDYDLMVYGATSTANFYRLGTFPIDLTVTDAAGQTDTDSTTVDVTQDDPPVADAGEDVDLDEHDAVNATWTVNFDGVASSDDHGIYSYQWEFHDASTATGQTASYTYTATGAYDVTLTVWDNALQSHSETITVTISPNAPPVAEAGPDQTWDEHDAVNATWTVSLDGSGSTDDVGIYDYSWDFGDGQTGTGVTVSHTYAGAGVRTVTLTVRDHALQAHSDTMTVTTLANDPPVAEAGSDQTLDEYDAADATWAVSFDGSASTDDVGIHSYAWDFGDGGSSTDIAPTHTYTSVGTYTVSLTVTDHALQTHTDTLTVTISPNDPPVADAGGPYSVAAADVAAGTASVLFDGTGSTDDVGIHRYIWDFGTETFDGYLNPHAWHYPMQTYPGAYITIYGASWGSRYLFSKHAVEKGSGLVFQAKVRCNGGTAMIGFKNDNTNFYYTQMPYAIYLYYGNIHIYEDGSSRGDTGYNINYNAWYDYRIEMDDTGVSYSYRPSGSGNPWTRVFRSTYVTSATRLKQGIVANSSTWNIDDIHRGAVGDQVDYPVYGACEATLTVEDQARQTDSDTTTVSVTGATPPTASAGGPYFATFETPMVFDGTGSTPGADIVHYEWDFGDGSVGYGPLAQHTYALGSHTADEVFTVTLTVTDRYGQTDTAATTATMGIGPKAICVPWQFSGGTEVPHTTWAGKSIRLKAIARGGTGTLQYTWNFGDGSAPVTGTVSNKRAIEISHAYTGTLGAKFNATLTVEDSGGRTDSDTYRVEIHPTGLDAKINVAIDEGLWWLHKNQASDGHWSSYSSYYASPTGSAVQAFFINGHLEVGDADEDPYVETVRKGMRYMFGQLRAVGIGTQTYGDPDTNANGIGVEVASNRPIYEGGMVMDAIVASATPGAVAWGGDTGVYGRSYKDILQDMCDMYAWGQFDDATYGGGWRYSWNQWPDNSACQWAAIGLLAAKETPWSCVVPEFVRQRNDVWLSYSDYWSGGQCIGFGYTGPSWGWALTPSGMVQVAMSVPDYKNDPRWYGPEAWFLSNWNNFMAQNNYYGYYAFVKAMRVSETELLAGSFDWYRAPNGMATEIVNAQNSAGWWSYYGYGFGTSWSVIMLTPSLFELPPVADAGGDVVWAYDLELEFDASNSYHLDPARTIVLYEWDFDGDGTYDSASTLPTAAHTYPDPDPPGDNGTPPTTYTVVLRVTDDEGRTDTDTRQVVVAEPPHAPYARITGPIKATVGLPITLSGADSFDIDPSDFITLYQWDLDGSDGYDFDSPDYQSTDPSDNTVTTTYTTPGTYFIGLRVWDNGVLNPPDYDHLSSEPEYFELEVEENLPPDADPGPDRTVDEGQLVTLDGTGSSDPNGDPITYAWDFGDGHTDTTNNPTPSHTWMDDGTYTVSLTVSDSLLSDTDTATITVRDLGPTANFAWTPGSPDECQPIAFSDASTSYPDPIVQWEWDFGDGGTSSDPNPSHTFGDAGTYDVSLTVTDDDGSVDTVILQVTVAGVPPTADFSVPGGPLPEGSDVAFTDLSSCAPCDDIVEWVWDFDDGGSSTDPSPHHTYDDEGTYNVSLTVTDDDGTTDTVVRQVIIADVPPTADFVVPAGPHHEGDDIAFTDTSTCAPCDDIVAWEWDFGDGATSTDQDPHHVYGDPGTYTVTLTVTDDDGTPHTTAQILTILDVQPTPAFSWHPDPTPEGTPTSFVDESSCAPCDDIVAWEWDVYGDGSVVYTTQNCQHTYSAPGTYTVTLTITDDDGTEASITHDVVVEGGGGPEEPECVDDSVQFTYGRIGYDRRTGLYVGTVRVTNTSAARLDAPLHLIIASIAPDSVTVTNADGTTPATGPLPASRPYFDLGGALNPGASVYVRVSFRNPARARFTFKCTCWHVPAP